MFVFVVSLFFPQAAMASSQPRKFIKSASSSRQSQRFKSEEMPPDSLPHKEVSRPMFVVDEVVLLKKQVARLLAEKEKKEEEENLQMQCYICQERMRCPLKVCSNGHHACAGCLRKQSNFTFGASYTKDYVNHIPVITIVKSNMSRLKCGPCGQPMQPNYPGSLLMNLVDPRCSTTCEFCNESFPLHKMGMHILECGSGEQVAECPWCYKKCEDINKHFLETCSVIPCEICLASRTQWSGTYLQMQVHVKAHQMGQRMIVQTQEMLNQVVIRNMHMGMGPFLHLCTVFLTLAESRDSNRVDGSDLGLMPKLRTELKTIDDEYHAMLAVAIDQDKRNDLLRRLNAVYEQTTKILVSVEEAFAADQAEEPEEPAEPEWSPSEPDYAPSSPHYTPTNPTYSPPPPQRVEPNYQMRAALHQRMVEQVRRGLERRGLDR